MPARRRSSQPAIVSTTRQAEIPTTANASMSIIAAMPSIDPLVGRVRSGSHGLYVLVAEDNEISQKLLKKQLIRAGCKVATANDGVEAVDYVLDSAAKAGGSFMGNEPMIDIILMGR
jgi:hypothetical protein